MSTWTPQQVAAYRGAAETFGQRHSAHHTEWHQANGPGGTNGPGSGEAFLGFHRGMMNDFRRETGWPAPQWDPSRPLPPGIQEPGTATGPALNPNVQRPNWLTTQGRGTSAGNSDFGSSVTMDGRTMRALGDFQNPDQLGRALAGEGAADSYHASAHARIGGTMGGFNSPEHSAFNAWHGHIDRLVTEWLDTPNGRNWAKNNPNHALLDPSLGHRDPRVQGLAGGD